MLRTDGTSIRSLRRALAGRVGVVPTMGALHDGHLELVRQARADCDHVIVTLYVNPLQFAAGEDFESYPRDLERDLALLDAAGVDVVFTPTVAQMRPSGYSTFVEVGDVSEGLEGAARPGHFRGVATVVSKLFHLTQPDIAYFGQKDAQQVVVIRRMVRDLAFPLEIAVIPTVREPDGLAMSSRNAYLKPDERRAAATLYRGMTAAAAAYEAGERQPEALIGVARAVIAAEPLAQIEYIALVDTVSLRPMTELLTTPALLTLTVKIGKPRLLDNCLLPLTLNTRAGLTATLGAA